MLYNFRTQFLFLIVFVLEVICSKNTMDCPLLCAEPQMRSMRVANLTNTHDDYYPYMIVLHRCDEGSGCCRKNYICKVAAIDDITIHVHRKVYNKYEPFEHKVMNHTKCSCQNINNVIK